MCLNEYARQGGVEVDIEVVARGEHGGDYTLTSVGLNYLQCGNDTVMFLVERY